MAYMQWGESLSVGVKEIDDQHKQLVGIINRAFEAKERNAPKKECSKILNELIEFVRVHFSTEENYFEEFKYPGVKEHILKHLEIIEKVMNLNNKFNAGEPLGFECIDLLKNWFEEHLKIEDKKYASFLKQAGAK